MRVIGCGNRERQDDAAGVLVAEELRRLGVEAVEIPGQAPALIEEWADQEDVIIIDAVVTGSAPPGTVHVWSGRMPELVLRSRLSNHGLGVAEAIRLSEALDRLPPRLRVYGIEAAGFEPGAAVTPEVLAAVRRVAGEIVAHVIPQPLTH